GVQQDPVRAGATVAGDRLLHSRERQVTLPVEAGTGIAGGSNCPARRAPARDSTGPQRQREVAAPQIRLMSAGAWCRPLRLNRSASVLDYFWLQTPPVFRK